MNTVVVVVALSIIVIALGVLKAPKAQKVRVPVTLPARRQKPGNGDR